MMYIRKQYKKTFTYAIRRLAKATRRLKQELLYAFEEEIMAPIKNLLLNRKK